MLVAYREFVLADADRFRVLFLDFEITRIAVSDQGPESYNFHITVVEKVQTAGRFGLLSTKGIARILFASIHGICILSAAIPDIGFPTSAHLRSMP